jgi:putative hydrolase of the HAD superfamily
VLDWGGVLTPPFRACVAGWAEREAVDLDHFLALLARHLGAGATVAAADNPFQAVECGRLPAGDFERWLAGALRPQTEQPAGQPAGGDRPVDPAGLLGRMFADAPLLEPMVALLRAVRAAGVPTALLSNSWGQPYPPGLAELFDATVISCTAGVRKPDPAAYLLAARLLGQPPERCLFVDDLRSNVAGAEAVGMTGLQHTDPADTVAVIAQHFDLAGLAADAPGPAGRAELPGGVGLTARDGGVDLPRARSGG